MQHPIRIRALIAGIVVLGLPVVAAAQAVFLARHVIGRIEQMSQSAPAGGASYDTATVIVEVAPEKVFSTIKRLFAKNTEVRVTGTDDVKRSIEFTDGSQIGGIQVNLLGDGLSQLMISTAHPGITTSTTSTIVARILNVCRELSVACQRAGS